MHPARAALLLMLWIFVVSVFVHFLWEMGQAFAYEMDGIPVATAVGFHFWATLGDGLLMWIQYGVVAAARRDPLWIARPRWSDLLPLAAAGLLFGAGIEWSALAAGRWRYTAAMPMVPLLNVGLFPVLQLLLLPWPIYWAAWRLSQPAPAFRDRTPLT
jgi:hypothetical protein